MVFTCTKTRAGTFIFYEDGKRVAKKHVPLDVQEKCKKKPNKDMYIPPIPKNASRKEKLISLKENCHKMSIKKIRDTVDDLKLGVKGNTKNKLCGLVKAVIRHEIEKPHVRTAVKKAKDVKKKTVPFSIALFAEDGNVYLSDAYDDVYTAKIVDGKVVYNGEEKGLFKDLYKVWKEHDKPYLLLFKLTKDQAIKNVHGVSLFSVPFKRRLPSGDREKREGVKRPSAPKSSYSVIFTGNEGGKKRIASANFTYDSKTFGDPTKFVNEMDIEDGQVVKLLRSSLKKWIASGSPDELYIDNVTGKVVFSR